MKFITSIILLLSSVALVAATPVESSENAANTIGRCFGGVCQINGHNHGCQTGNCRPVQDDGKSCNNNGGKVHCP
ncbi:hypothetical protein ASPWEDRAFT_175779 [Aspergillus wentii DTO 134E9]|uniref:Antifungal protein n=1 Tax=Aspergillus wentii DTO 134E9 TaxID=1073089 RepID=A0A1L9RC77_ASPWE|nr:uncharacterized protein ASPWEDRAFT_175779 [Aspergillus wentii DTO 134E9]KAI9935059.1 hypothetical protein MW887_000680 [Aspergillus wentii]OJJ32498.1 hypothetical protein ASPWEDRAFT_175779 [Aspergillus wentii DTO 134E9]